MRIDHSSFATQDLRQFQSVLTPSRVHFDTADTPGPWAAQSLEIDGNAFGPNGGCRLEYAAIDPTEFTIRFRVKQTPYLPASGFNPRTEHIVDFSAPAGDQCSIGIRNNSGVMTLVAMNGSTILATPDRTLPLDQWVLVEARVVIDDSAGEFEIRQDGSTIFSETGLDTKRQTLQDYVNAVTFWAFYAPGGNQIIGGTSKTKFADYTLNDSTTARNNTWIGDGRVAALYVEADGDVTELLLGGTTPAAANWDSVEEVPANDDEDFVYSSNVGDKDLYELTASEADTANVSGVIIRMKAQKELAGEANIASLIKTNTFEDEGDTQVITTEWDYYAQLYTQNPITVDDWTKADLDALQAGVVVR